MIYLFRTKHKEYEIEAEKYSAALFLFEALTDDIILSVQWIHNQQQS